MRCHWDDLLFAKFGCMIDQKIDDNIAFTGLQENRHDDLWYLLFYAMPNQMNWMWKEVVKRRTRSRKNRGKVV